MRTQLLLYLLLATGYETCTLTGVLIKTFAPSNTHTQYTPPPSRCLVIGFRPDGKMAWKRSFSQKTLLITDAVIRRKFHKQHC